MVRHRRTLETATGDRFNIFHILGAGHIEYAHSSFLAELLNPQGGHSQGALYLSLFVKQFTIPNFDTKNATLTQEYHCGEVTEISGGRVDLVIRDGLDNHIVIENKIHAGDQDNQMLRYRNEFNNLEKHQLFYLTLEGKKPSNVDEEKIAELKIKLISYRTDILTWLQESRKASALLPTVRETITQYIRLIEELTNQSTTRQMNQELIKDIISTPQHLNAFYTLCDAKTTVENELLELLHNQLNEIAKKHALEPHLVVKDRYATKDNGFFFKNDALLKNNIRIAFYFDDNNLTNFGYGFVKYNETLPCLIKERLIEECRKIDREFHFQGISGDEMFPAFNYCNTYIKWEKEAFEDIQNGTLATVFEERIERLLSAFNAACSNSGDAKTSIESIASDTNAH